MNRYRSKPQEVEAVQYTGSNKSELLEFAGDKVSWDPGGFAYLLAGPDLGNQSWQALPPGYWVVRNPSDARNYWQLSSGYFEGEYEPMQGAEQGEADPQPERCPRCRAAITQYKRWCEDCVNLSNEDEVLGRSETVRADSPPPADDASPKDWRESEGYL